MAGNSRNAEQVRLEIEAEREQLTGAVDSLRSGISEAANIGTKLRAKLPVVAAGAVGVGFVFAGGLGAVMRLVTHRGRESRKKSRFGRFSRGDRD